MKNGVPMGPKSEWIDGYVFHGNADKVFRDFFGGDNPFAGNIQIKRNIDVKIRMIYRILCKCRSR